MKRFLLAMLQKMSDCITSFWLIDQDTDEASTIYPDYPVKLFGSTRLIGKETLKNLLK